MNSFIEKILKADPYIIAEIGVNHEGSMDKAKELIDLAKEGGADAVKFQSYKAEKIASRNSPYYWDIKEEPTRSQYDLFRKYDSFGETEYRELHAYTGEQGIDFMSTPFDLEAVDFLDPLMPCFKIASADITNLPLLKKIGSTGKPVLISTGASNTDEIDAAVDILRNAGTEDIVLMHCVLNYPTKDGDAHLKMIAGLKDRYPGHMIGYSDHTVPDADMTCLTTAWLIGAKVIEKHFTFDKTLPGNDHYHAMDADDMKILLKKINQIKALLGEEKEKGPLEK
ncbi:MAG: N-acetylneuraminate synthase family protein, partial [Spirochaetota bacterium]|nr:N-acetylneuraminate synthase family protein [Spirochaetota bacterium]